LIKNWSYAVFYSIFSLEKITVLRKFFCGKFGAILFLQIIIYPLSFFVFENRNYLIEKEIQLVSALIYFPNQLRTIKEKL
jgi:hypothetical protein